METDVRLWMRINRTNASNAEILDTIDRVDDRSHELDWSECEMSEVHALILSANTEVISERIAGS